MQLTSRARALDQRREHAPLDAPQTQASGSVIVHCPGRPFIWARRVGRMGAFPPICAAASEFARSCEAVCTRTALARSPPSSDEGNWKHSAPEMRSLSQQSSGEFTPAVPTTKRGDGKIQGHQDATEVCTCSHLDPQPLQPRPSPQSPRSLQAEPLRRASRMVSPRRMNPVVSWHSLDKFMLGRHRRRMFPLFANVRFYRSSHPLGQNNLKNYWQG